MATKKDDTIYVRVPYAGFIAPINLVGPLKCFLPRADVIALIQARYEVILLNPASCPEFAEQLVAYNEMIKEAKFQEAQKIIADLRVADNPMAKAIRKANEEAEALANIPRTPNGGSPIIDKVIDEANKAAINSGLSVNIQTTPVDVEDAERQNTYTEELDNISEESAPIDIPDVLLPEAVEKSAEENAAPPPVPSEEGSGDIHPRKKRH